jgi:hypothetical protein
MAFKLKATTASGSGGYGVSFELNEDIITSVRYMTDTPNDENSRSNDVSAILEIKGTLTQNEQDLQETKKVAVWSLEKKNPYVNIVVQQISSTLMMREYTFTRAFCVDYTEEFYEDQGNGKFTLIIKQEKKDIENVKIEGGYGA